MSDPGIDEIGPWSEVKLEIVRKYAKRYSTILSTQPGLTHVYIDGFAGAGVNVSRMSGAVVPGSASIALEIDPPFAEYHLVDLDPSRAEALRRLQSNRPNVFVYQGDCNRVLLQNIIPNVQYVQYRRGLCLLDPYGLDLSWKVIEAAGKSNAIDLFLNFPVMDMNRNVLWKNREAVEPAQAERMTFFWGDESWRDAAWDTKRDLFGHPEKVENEAIAAVFQDRLQRVAGFKYVPDPMPMRISTGAVVYYLFFAAQKRPANDIVTYIFNKYRDWGKR